MWRAFIDWLFPEQPIVFPSDYSLADSVARLRAAVQPNAIDGMFRNCAAGPVSEDFVRLQHVIPMFSNSFKPYFYGAFEESGGRVVLRGRFTAAISAKLFMTVWLGFAALWTIVALVVGGAAPVELGHGVVVVVPPVVFPVIGFAFLAFGIGMVKLGWGLSRGDIAFFSRTIEEALQK